jgi:hypothetical protein
MDYHIDGFDIMALGDIRQIGKLYLPGRNIIEQVSFGIIKMMMVVGIGIEHTVFVMDRHPSQQTGIGELVQRVIDGAKRYLDAGVLDFAGQAVCRNMPVTAIQQQ